MDRVRNLRGKKLAPTGCATCYPEMLANHYIDELKWRIYIHIFGKGKKGRDIGRRTNRGLSNVIRMVRLFFEVQLDSHVKRKFGWQFFFLFSSFFLISVRNKYLCKEIVLEESITFFSNYLQKKKHIYKEDIPLFAKQKVRRRTAMFR